MSTNGETADLMVREGIQITESALKLAGLGAKNLAALLIALANDNQKLAGKTTLKRLIHDGEELTIFSVKQEDLKGFQMEAKRYGVLFYPIVNKVEKTGTVEIMAKAKDAKQINRIFERKGIWSSVSLPSICFWMRSMNEPYSLDFSSREWVISLKAVGSRYLRERSSSSHFMRCIPSRWAMGA